MAVKTIPYLRARSLVGGSLLWYWIPSAELKAAGWRQMPLGKDEDAAVAAALVRNAEISKWRAGALMPQAIATRIPPGTVSAMIAHFKADYPNNPAWPSVKHHGKTLAYKTKSQYQTAFDRLEKWVGEFPVGSVTKARVDKFRNDLLKEKGLAVTHATLRVARVLWRYGAEHRLCFGANPFERFGLATPDPRQEVWDADGGTRELDAIKRAAAAIGHAEIGFAIDLFLMIGQRAADVIELGRSNWKELRMTLPREQRAILVNDDGPDAGRLMGFSLAQRKTTALVGVPVAGDLRRAVEAQFARNASRGIDKLLVNEKEGRAWRDHRELWGKFDEARERAAADNPDMPKLATLQLRDLRRTAIVRMGELGLSDQEVAAVSGHKLATIKKILETYMPRNTRMSASAIATVMAARKAEAAEGQAALPAPRLALPAPDPAPDPEPAAEPAAEPLEAPAPVLEAPRPAPPAGDADAIDAALKAYRSAIARKGGQASSKLAPDAVLAIRRMAARKVPQKEIARRFAVSFQRISQIANGRKIDPALLVDDGRALPDYPDA